MPDDSTEVVLQLTKAEALVLFEFVSRFSNTDVLDLQNRAEAQALWNVCGLLAKQLVEPFQPEFCDLLQAARDELSPSDIEG